MESWIWILVPITALMIPIVAILVVHQQKMAQILHGGAARVDSDRLASELARLSARIDELSLQVDSLASGPRSLQIQDRTNVLP